jgi:hypothetical protein
VPRGHNGKAKTDNAGKDRSKTGIMVIGIKYDKKDKKFRLSKVK